MQLLHQPITAADPIPDRFYIIIMEFFVAVSQKFLLVKRLHAAARKNGCFHRLHRAKLQSNAWGMPGGRWAILELNGIHVHVLNPLSNKPLTL